MYFGALTAEEKAARREARTQRLAMKAAHAARMGVPMERISSLTRIPKGQTRTAAEIYAPGEAASKGAINPLLLIGGAAAAWFFFRKKKRA